jgi:hypothetical protein
MKSPGAVNLYNAVAVSQQRLGRRVAQLSAARMNEVCAALRFSLWCNSNLSLETFRLSPNFVSPNLFPTVVVSDKIKSGLHGTK